MTSYLRSILSGNPTQLTPMNAHSSEGHSNQRSKSNSRSYPAPTINGVTAAYIYATPSTTLTSSYSRPRPTTKRSQSFSAHATVPSPLLYGTYESGDVGFATGGDGRRGREQNRHPLSRRQASDNSRGQYSAYASSSDYAGSRSNSSSSFQHASNHTWDSSQSASGRAASSQVPLNLHTSTQRHADSLHMHPLLAATRIHTAPISYDVLYTPSTRTVVDRTTHMAVPAHTLSQPATDPPVPISSRVVLRSDKFPWPIVVGSSSPPKPGSRFYLGCSEKSRTTITNLDVLYALHTTLLARVTPQEWEALGHGSRAQEKVTQAYERRCKRMGGGWEEGVKRIDWLHGKTRLIGVEVDRYAQDHGTGILIFGKP